VVELVRSITLGPDSHHRPARRPRSWEPARLRRTAALVAVNSMQVFLTWWILREVATASRSLQSVRAGVLRVAVLVAANALQTGLTWWIYRKPTS
jgi:hypothetical protein